MAGDDYSWVTAGVAPAPTSKPHTPHTPAATKKKPSAVVDAMAPANAGEPNLPLAHKALSLLEGMASFGPHAVMQAIDTVTGGQGSALASKGMNLLDAVPTMAGAALLDVEKHRNPFPNEGPRGQNTATQHAQDLMAQGKFGEAASRYSLFNLGATRSRAEQTHEPFAEWSAGHGKTHPTDFGLMAGVGEAANPGMIGAGKIAGAALDEAGPMIRGAGGVSEGAGNRMGEVRNAARREAADAGAPPYEAQQAAEKAEQAGHIITNAPQWARSTARKLARKVMDGLTPEQRLRFVDIIEGEDPLTTPEHTSKVSGAAMNRVDALGNVRPMTTKQTAAASAGGRAKLEAMRNEPEAKLLMSRVNDYRKMMGEVDLSQIGAGLDPARLWKSDRYFPRRGFSLDPTNELDEDVQEALMQNRSRGGMNYRKGTAGDRVHRTYPTRQAAIRAGVKVNPDWDPAVALENHLAQRLQNVRINDALQRFEDLGLVVPRDTRTDYLPFTEVGNVRTFGAPLTRPSAVDRSIIGLLNDIQPEAALNGVGMAAPSARAGLLSKWQHSAGKAVRGAANAANYAAARLEVSDPVYHPAVNLRPRFFEEGQPNILQRGRRAANLIDSLLTGRGVDEADAVGAALPYQSPLAPEEGEVPFSKRTLRGKATSIVEGLTSKPLYQGIEPRMAAALYKSLRQEGYSEAEAVNRTRGFVGNPENLTKFERERVAPWLIFPSWLKSQMLYWPQAIARNPALYAGPHRAVEARNAAYGRSPQPNDAYYMIPPFVMSKRAGGGFNMGEIPHPANRVVGLAALAADALTGNANDQKVVTAVSNLLNPIAASGIRTAATLSAPAQEPGYGILWDKDASGGKKALQAAGNAVGAYSPSRGLQSPYGAAVGTATGLLGLSTYETDAGTPNASARFKVEKLFREGYWGHGKADMPGIEDYRRAAVRARKAGNMQQARTFDAYANTLYDKMQATLDALGAHP